MQFLGVHPGLTHRLLVAAARARLEGEPPCDWTDLVERANISASHRAITRALSHLAENGLIEGVYTRSGWMHCQVTARGLRRAGGAARRPAKQRPIPPAPAPGTLQAFDEDPPVLTSQPVLDQSPTISAESDVVPAGEMANPLVARFSNAISLRVLAFRTHLQQALNVFKTLP